LHTNLNAACLLGIFLFEFMALEYFIRHSTVATTVAPAVAALLQRDPLSPLSHLATG
jgi:hypothetical protein